MEDHIRHLEDEKIKNEKLHETTAALNRELKLEIQEVTEEKDQILSKLHAMEQQREHNCTEQRADRTGLEKATVFTLGGNMLTQQLRQKSLAERKFQSMKRQIEEGLEAVR